MTVGENSIKIDQTGVTISGLMISIKGQVQTQVQGVMTQVSGDAMTQISGGIIMIG
jgi:type VI secretion system secreted protein VgrG